MSSEEIVKSYKLKQSLVGELESVKYAADGELLDGNHRLDEDPNWKKETLLNIVTDRQKWAARIQYNIKRQNKPETDAANYILNLKRAIEGEIKRGELPKDTRVVPQLIRDSGLEEPYVRAILAKYDPMIKKDVLHHQLDRKKKEGEESIFPEGEEVEGEQPYAPVMPEKGSDEYNKQVWTTIQGFLGSPLEEIVNKLKMALDMTENEARNAILGYKVYNPPLWARMYDANDKPRQGVQLPPLEAAPQPPKRTYTADTLYDEAFDWYPENVVEAHWDKAGAPSEKQRFLKAYFTVCREEALKTLSDDVLLQLAAKLTFG